MLQVGGANLLVGTGRFALMIGMLCFAAPGKAQVAPTATPPDAGRAARDAVTMSVPLIWDSQVLGEVIVQAASDGSVAIESQSFRNELGPVLNEAGVQRLAEVIGGDPFVVPAELEAGGFAVSFNMAGLELVVAAINPDLRPIQRIGYEDIAQEQLQPNIEAASFSAYMNIGANLRYGPEGGIRPPDIFLFGASRYKDVVLEFDGGFAEDFDGGGYRFFRRGVRAIYDEPESYRRWSAGDLRLQGSTFLDTPFIAGVAVEKSRRVFNSFSPVTSLGGRQIFIGTPSTVEVLVNGAPYQVLNLQPGTYSLEDLPIQTGSNDVQIVVRDAAGREEVTRFGYFYAPTDLVAGEEEYVAALGLVARELSLQPDYSGDPIFVANYRRGLSDFLVLGGGVQLTQDIQVVSVESQIVPQVVPGSFELNAAVSNGDGLGITARAGYRVPLGTGMEAKRIFLNVDYQSEGFRTPGDLGLFSTERLSANASYSQAISSRTSLVAGASYFMRGAGPDQSNYFVDVNHRLRPNIRASVGVEYGSGSFFERSFGVRASITMLLGGRHRADASYQSRRGYARASISRGVENHVGSIGYSVNMQKSPGSTSVDGLFDYIGNRFDARLALTTQGAGFGDVADEQSGSLQIGTSIAFADGTFGIGRPISDSFLLASPHETISKNGVIVGRGLQDGTYEAASGIFGAAVANRLGSYSIQDVQYDLKESRAGYDIGAGVVRVDPPYRSGYALTIGTDRFVSAVGFLKIGGQPAALVAGTITSADGEDFEPQPFFTNSAGRFGIIGLAPGGNYTVRLHDGRTFSIAVPADNQGLYRMETIDLPNGS